MPFPISNPEFEIATTSKRIWNLSASCLGIIHFSSTKWIRNASFSNRLRRLAPTQHAFIRYQHSTAHIQQRVREKNYSNCSAICHSNIHYSSLLPETVSHWGHFCFWNFIHAAIRYVMFSASIFVMCQNITKTLRKNRRTKKIDRKFSHSHVRSHAIFIVLNWSNDTSVQSWRAEEVKIKTNNKKITVKWSEVKVKIRKQHTVRYDIRAIVQRLSSDMDKSNCTNSRSIGQIATHLDRNRTNSFLLFDHFFRFVSLLCTCRVCLQRRHRWCRCRLAGVAEELRLSQNGR